MNLVYYISGHGLGHAVRSADVMRCLPAHTSLTIVSGVPEQFFRRELSREFQFRVDVFDCGAVQADALTVDRKATLHTYSEMAERNGRRIGSERDWLESSHADLVVSDVAPFPLVAARAAGVPSSCIASFTWVEIYRPYVERFPEFEPLIDEMALQYAQADLAIVLPLSVPMPAFRRTVNSPLVAECGESRRDEMADAYGLDLARRWWLFYPGNLPFEFDWQSLEALDEYEILSYYAPETLPANLTRLRQNEFRNEDVMASVDGAISKPGYGMVAQCMANRTPLMYTNREHFAEYEALDKELQIWGGAVRISQNDYRAGSWSESLQRLETIRSLPHFRCDGGTVIAQELVKLAEGRKRGQSRAFEA